MPRGKRFRAALTRGSGGNCGWSRQACAALGDGAQSQLAQPVSPPTDALGERLAL